jgi:5-methylcytosine-specific restriction endonuclease McrA
MERRASLCYFLHPVRRWIRYHVSVPRYPQLADQDWVIARAEEPLRHVAEEVGCSVSAVSYAFKRLGIEPAGRQPCQEGCGCGVHSDETKSKLREKRAGKTPTLGHKWPEDDPRRLAGGTTKGKSWKWPKGAKPPNKDQSVSRTCHYPGCDAVIVTSPSLARVKGCCRAHGRAPAAGQAYPPGWPRTRRRVWERDGYACALCGADLRGGSPHAHHLNYDKRDCQPGNLATLCTPCHLGGHRKNEWPSDLGMLTARRGPL